MSTTPLTDAITALTTYSNTVTGASDTDLSSAVATLAAGYGSGAELVPLDVNFYDYDGTLLYAYTAVDFLALSGFPSNPSHDGLTAQGWNWTLTGAKTYVQSYGFLQIGQTYEPTDEATHVHIGIEDIRFSTYTIYCPVGWVDWGDGSDIETVSSAGDKTHTYASTGDYIIRLYGSSDWSFSTPSNSMKYLIKEINFSKNVKQLTANQCADLYNLERISIPKNGLFTTSVANCLRNSFSLTGFVLPIGFVKWDSGGGGESLKAICLNEGLSGSFTPMGNITEVKALTVPTGVTAVKIGNYSIKQLKTLIMPDTVTSFSGGNDAQSLVNLHLSVNASGAITESPILTNVRRLRELTIPDGITSFGYYAFNSLHNCYRITIGSGMTNLGSQSFMDCYLTLEIHMKPTTPPTKSVYNFRNIPSNCVIYVPYSADHSILSAYQSASNWSSLASYMVEESL